MKTQFKIVLAAISLLMLISFKADQNIHNPEATYTLHGDGPKKVIVLHSWMGDSESWLPTIAHLNLERSSFAFVDVRGYGRSKDIKGKYTCDEIASDIFSVAKELGWKQFYLIGHSMTGMAVQKAALLDTKAAVLKVMAITPVSSAGFPIDDENLNFFKAIIQNQQIANKAYRVFTSNRLSGTWYANQAKRHVLVTDKDAQLAYIDMWTKENFFDQMKTVKTPFVVLSGQYDHPGFRADAQKKAFSQLQNVNHIEIENSGHFPMQETPIYLAAQIEAFLN